MLMSPEVAAELERLRARVAELEAERRSTNEALDDAVQALRLRNTQRGDVELLIEQERGFGEECVDIGKLEDALGLGSDDEVVEAGPSVEMSADKLTALVAPAQSLQPVGDDVRPQVRKLRALLAGQHAQTGGAS
jgi:hypothetical protein